MQTATATRSTESAATGSPSSAVKRLVVAPIARHEAIGQVLRYHYSRGFVRNSRLHLGVFLDGRLVGAMQFGPPLDRRKVIGHVPGTSWNGMLELNRMAMSPRVPRMGESRVIAAACRMIRRHAPHIGWILSFADAGRCGDGAIYRASGFALTGVKMTEFMKMPSGKFVHRLAVTANAPIATGGSCSLAEFAKRTGAVRVKAPSIRYIKLLDPQLKLKDPPLPFERLTELGVRCYRGRQTRARGVTVHAGQPGRRGRFNSYPRASKRVTKVKHAPDDGWRASATQNDKSGVK